MRFNLLEYPQSPWYHQLQESQPLPVIQAQAFQYNNEDVTVFLSEDALLFYETVILY